MTPEAEAAGGSSNPQPDSGGCPGTLPDKVPQLRFGKELPENFRWVPISELASLEFPPANRPVIQILLRDLSETGSTQSNPPANREAASTE